MWKIDREQYIHMMSKYHLRFAVRQKENCDFTIEDLIITTWTQWSTTASVTEKQSEIMYDIK